VLVTIIRWLPAALLGRCLSARLVLSGSFLGQTQAPTVAHACVSHHAQSTRGSFRHARTRFHVQAPHPKPETPNPKSIFTHCAIAAPPNPRSLLQTLRARTSRKGTSARARKTAQGCVRRSPRLDGAHVRAAGRQRAAPRAHVCTAGASLRTPVQRDPLVLFVVAADIVHPDLFLLDLGHCRVPPLPLGQHLHRAPLCQLQAHRQRSGQGALRRAPVHRPPLPAWRTPGTRNTHLYAFKRCHA
jgi:hypothetical protein